MKNLLIALTIAIAFSAVTGCVSRNIVEQQQPATIAAATAPTPASPEISPDVNFKASNTMPGGPGL